MKKNKNYFSIIGMVLVCGVLITSCKDEFDEEQLFLSQQERSDQIAAQDAEEKAAEEAENAAILAAVQLLDYTVTLHTDDVPAEGVAVNVINTAGTTASATTDASGNAVFSDLTMGGHTVTISSADHLNASYNVDFGTPVSGVHYEIIDGKVYSLGSTAESSKVELFSLSGMNTATITGRVEIETDLTNNTPEVPQDITIRANLDAATPANSHSFIDDDGNTSSIYVSGSFTFTEGDIGMATVDNTTGEYTMQVPATDDGVDIELLLPLVEAEQTLGWAFEDGEYVGIQVGPQAALFGPDVLTANTPSIAGVVAEFDPVPEPGRGFNLANLERMPTDLKNNNENMNDQTNDFEINSFPLEAVSGTRFRGSQGSGYQLTPVVTVSAPDLTGPEAVNATIEAWMDWTLESVAYTGEPAFTYGQNEQITISLEISDEDGVQDVYELAQINAGVVGQLEAGSVDVDPILLMAPEGDNVITTNYIVTSFDITFTGAGDPTGTLTKSGTVDTFMGTDDGGGYTSIPTITVEAAPEGGTNATLEIYDMSFKYAFDLDNSGVTQGYIALPPEISFNFERVPGVFENTTDIDLITLNEDGFADDVLIFDGVQDPNLDELTDGLIVSDGSLAFNNLLFGNELSDPTKTVDKGQTRFSYSMPEVIIVEPTHEQTTANVDVNSDGEITGLSDIKIGTGYTTEQDFELISQSGTGAQIDLSGFTVDELTGEVTWSGNFVVTDGGSDYISSMNIDKEDFTPSASSQVIKVRNGETKIVNINYGTGATEIDVQDPPKF